jgi:superfamily I DNA/RNA helicase
MAVLYRRQAQLEVLLSVLSKDEIPCRVVYKKALPYEEFDDFSNDENGVNLLTLHASKGLEFSHVFIIGANMGNMPLSSKSSEEPEELRLFYVGITRARNHLEISYLAKPSLQGAQGYKSPYITMLPKDLLIIEEDSLEPKNSISNLINILRQDRMEKENQSAKQNRVKHLKYGIGNIVYEDEEVIRVAFEVYGVKEFSKLFCPLERI